MAVLLSTKQNDIFLRLSKMKVLHFAVFFAGTLFTACQSDSSKSNVALADSTQNIHLDSATLIRPGESIGNIFLGKDIQAATSILGSPDAGDAAMGKAWGIWYDKDSTAHQKSEIAIYSTYKDSTMMGKDIKQIRINGKRFKTAEGLGVGNTLSDFKGAYPDLKLQSKFLYASSDTMELYDSESRGLSVEFRRNTSQAITVHKTETAVNESYFTFDPNLKKIQP